MLSIWQRHNASEKQRALEIELQKPATICDTITYFVWDRSHDAGIGEDGGLQLVCRLLEPNFLSTTYIAHEDDARVLRDALGGSRSHDFVTVALCALTSVYPSYGQAKRVHDESIVGPFLRCNVCEYRWGKLCEHRKQGYAGLMPGAL